MAEVGAILRKQQEKLGELLCKKTHFLPTEIQGLLNVHRRLQMTPKSNDSNAGNVLNSHNSLLIKSIEFYLKTLHLKQTII